MKNSEDLYHDWVDDVALDAECMDWCFWHHSFEDFDSISNG